eukprot:SAG25_NODE_1997_length_2045_cov_2.278006_1_plen_106_part_00
MLPAVPASNGANALPSPGDTIVGAEVQAKIAELEAAKAKAVATEDYDEAKKLKQQIELLQVCVMSELHRRRRTSQCIRVCYGPPYTDQHICPLPSSEGPTTGGGR